MDLNVSVHSVLCFTLLFECVLQGNVVYRGLVQWVNCRLGSGCLTGMGAGLWLLLEEVSRMVLGTCLGGVPGHKVGTGFGMDNLQQWGAGVGCEGGWGCGFVSKWMHGCHRVPQ